MCREELVGRLMFVCAHPLLADSLPFRSSQQPGAGANSLSASTTLDRIALAFVRTTQFTCISDYVLFRSYEYATTTKCTGTGR